MLTLSACDLSQKKPETIRASLPHGSTQTVPSALAVPLPPGPANVHAPGVGRGGPTGVEHGAGEGSIRLYGPGVSRKRQTRV
jgi:hypothetical protein